MTNKVVSLGDSLLRKIDVELLEGPFWLNDNVISFYYEYLTLRKYKDNLDTLFVGPGVTHCLKAANEDELPIFLDPIEAKKKRYVFFAFNDERQFEKCGGTHWSLLVFSKPDMTIYHVDSMTGTNSKQAMKISGKLLSYFSPTGRGDYEEINCLQQDNGYDCGIFVICHTEFFMDHCIKYSSFMESGGKITKEDVICKRSEMLQLIEELSRQ